MAPCKRGRKATEAVVLLSGGIDSATCLRLVKARGDAVRAITVRINGSSKGELLAARRLAESVGVVEHRFVSVPELREAADITTGPLSSGRVPGTYIPMKNAVYYSLAAAYADETGSEVLVGGHNKDDLAVFQDAGDLFFSSLQRALRAGSPRLRSLRIERPLKGRTKSQVVEIASRIGVPLELTWSCHSDGERQCGRCEGCRARAEAFSEAGIRDPLRS